jgi:hypothetical protein
MMNDVAARSIVRQPGMFAATVYVTGRGVRGSPTTLGRPGTIDDAAEEVSARRGTGIAVRCDHTDDRSGQAHGGA